MKIYIKSSGEDITYKELKSRINKATTQLELDKIEDIVLDTYRKDLIAKGEYKELMNMVAEVRYEIMYDLSDTDVESYTPSATMRDYSPSSPWNAPGMSVSDFI